MGPRCFFALFMDRGCIACFQRKFWIDHKTTLDTVTKLLEKGDEWAVKVDELHSALLSERKLASSDKTVWLGTMNETVSKGQAALREWGDHCNGIKNQVS